MGAWFRIVTSRCMWPIAVFLLATVADVALASILWAGLGVEPFKLLFTPLPLAFAVFYGGMRGVFYHPVYDASYLHWLRTTPWQAGQPLPGGPVHIMLQDILVMLVPIAVLPLYRFDTLKPWMADPLNLTTAALFAYLFVRAVAALLLANFRIAYLMFFCLIGMTYTLRFHESSVSLALGMAAYALSLVSLGMEMTTIAAPQWVPFRALTVGIEGKPGDSEMRFQHPTTQARVMADRHREAGEEICLLSPSNPDPAPLPLEHAVWLSAMLAWVFLIIDAHSAWSVGSVVGAVVAIFMFIRAALYMNVAGAPLNFWGRVALGKLVIPRRDIYLVGVALTGVSAWLAWHATASLPEAARPALTVWVAAFVAMAVGPTRRWFRLASAGQLRMTRHCKQAPGA